MVYLLLLFSCEWANLMKSLQVSNYNVTLLQIELSFLAFIDGHFHMRIWSHGN